MNCCLECFVDDEIKDIISHHGEQGTCDFCGAKGVSIYPIDKQPDISDIISDIISVYEDSPDGIPLSEMIIKNWNIFDAHIPSSYNLFQAFYSLIYADASDLSNKKVCLSRHLLNEYGIFSGHSWAEFSAGIKDNNRFFNNFKPERFSNFLSYSIVKYKKGEHFFRARISPEKGGFHKDEMGPPPAGKRKPGRINPEGIGVLYLASDEYTALCEVRASAYDYISIGDFVLKRDINVVNLSKLSNISPVIYSSNIELLAANVSVFSDMAEEIAKPLRRNDSYLEYIPTQYIAEFIKSQGYNGVAYNSAMGTGGTNIAAFDQSLFECKSVHNVEIGKIKYEYSEIKT